MHVVNVCVYVCGMCVCVLESMTKPYRNATHTHHMLKRRGLLNGKINDFLRTWLLKGKANKFDPSLSRSPGPTSTLFTTNKPITFTSTHTYMYIHMDTPYMYTHIHVHTHVRTCTPLQVQCRVLLASDKNHNTKQYNCLYSHRPFPTSLTASVAGLGV